MEGDTCDYNLVSTFCVSALNQLSQQQQDELFRALTSGRFGPIDAAGTGLSLTDVISPPNPQTVNPVDTPAGEASRGPLSDPAQQRPPAQDIPLPIDPLTGQEVTPSGQLPSSQASFANIRLPETPVNEPQVAAGRSDAELLRTLEALAAGGGGQQQKLPTGEPAQQQQRQELASIQQLLLQQSLQEQEQLRKFQQLQQSFQTAETPVQQQLPASLLGLQGQNRVPNQAPTQQQPVPDQPLTQQEQMEQLMRQLQNMAANQMLNRNEVPPPVVPTPPQPALTPTGRSLEQKPNKPFFTARCKDCNVALGDKELLNFLGDLVEQQQQQQQEPMTAQQKRIAEALKHSFDLTCDNCNVLVGGKEALVAAAENMFYAGTGKPAKKSP